MTYPAKAAALAGLPTPGKVPCPSWLLRQSLTVSTAARLILNYKNIHYTTHWLEYPQIGPYLSSLGLPPNPSKPTYTLPTIRLPDGTHMMDSKPIATALEEKYPSPPLHPDAPEVARIEELMLALRPPMIGIVMPKILRTLCTPESEDTFRETRKQRFGMPLDQLERERGGEAQWEEATPVIQEMGKLLQEKEGGPFVRGREVSYADFYLLGYLRMLERLGEGLLGRVVEIEPSFGRLYDAGRVWIERDT